MHPQLTLNLGLRYELDTDVNNVSRVDQLNPLILPFLTGERKRDKNNFAPRVGFNFSTKDMRTSIHGGYGIYYDRVTLEIQTLERGLDGGQGRGRVMALRDSGPWPFQPDNLGRPYLRRYRRQAFRQSPPANRLLRRYQSREG